MRPTCFVVLPDKLLGGEAVSRDAHDRDNEEPGSHNADYSSQPSHAVLGWFQWRESRVENQNRSVAGTLPSCWPWYSSPGFLSLLTKPRPRRQKAQPLNPGPFAGNRYGWSMALQSCLESTHQRDSNIFQENGLTTKSSSTLIREASSGMESPASAWRPARAPIRCC